MSGLFLEIECVILEENVFFRFRGMARIKIFLNYEKYNPITEEEERWKTRKRFSQTESGDEAGQKLHRQAEPEA